MTLFPHNELRNAFLFAESGNQALLIAKRVRGKPQLARLIDHDTDRLYATARRLGLRYVHIERGGLIGQHVVFEGRPLDRAMSECAAMELNLV